MTVQRDEIRSTILTLPPDLIKEIASQLGIDNVANVPSKITVTAIPQVIAKTHGYQPGSASVSALTVA